MRVRGMSRLAAAGLVAALVAGPSTEAVSAEAAPRTAPVALGGCGWRSSLAQQNTPASLRSGVVKLAAFRPAKVRLSGDVDWNTNPYHDPTWQLWFVSLKWMESLVTDGNAADLQLAKRIVADFMHDRPDSGRNTGAWDDHATALRTSELVCMYQQGDASLRSWLRPIIRTHASVLIHRYAGPYNHGTMQSLALLASGCELGQSSWRKTAADRLSNELRRSIDAQGAIDEQAVGYAPFIQRLFRDAREALAACDLPVPPGWDERIEGVDTFAAEAMRPNGTFVELGDTWPEHAVGMGPNTRWISSRGAQGTMPENVKVYDAGFVFGRDSWVNTGQMYSLRFGPGRYVHGHDDHLAMTYWAAGHDVLVDSGYAGYADNTFRTWSRSLAAHNVPIVSGAKFSQIAATRLVGRSSSADTRTFEMRDNAFAGSERHRTVLVDDAMQLMLVRDDVTSSSKRALDVTWHLDPSWRKESVGKGRATFLSKDGTQRATVLQIALPGSRLPVNSSTLTRGYVSRSRNDRTRDWVVHEHRAAALRNSVITLVLVTPVSTPVTMSRAAGAGGTTQITVTAGTTTRVYTSARRGGMSPS